MKKPMMIGMMKMRTTGEMNNDNYGENALMAVIIMILGIFGGGMLMVIAIWILSFI